jgi:hypothetical protein
MLAAGYWTRGGFMHRCCSGFLLIITIAFAIAFTGCFGKSTSNASNVGVKSVSLSPSSDFSMDVGAMQVFTTSATDASGHTIVGTAQYFVASGTPGAPAPLSVASNGNACAGSWDPTVSICSPGNAGIAIVTAVVNGVSSPPTTVYVHFHIDSLQVVPVQQMPPPYDCFSQGQTWFYQGVAYSNGIDVTSTVGQLSWSSTNLGVLTPTPYIPPNQPNVLNQVQITAKSPGITQLYATVSGTTSSPLPITTCLVQYVRVRPQGLSGNSLTINTGTPITLQATAVDTLGFTLTQPPLTWSTTNPEVLSFSALTTTTGTNSATARANLGGADITASCTPPICNIGIAGYQDPQHPEYGVLPGMPVYASAGPLPNGLQGYGAISVNVTTTSQPPTYSAWAATTMCGNAPGCNSVMFQITPTQGGANPIGATLGVPRTPNSLMFNYQSPGRIYLGSEQGLMYADVGSSSPKLSLVSSQTTPCNLTLCGTVLAISNDGKQVVVSDNVSATPQVYIYNASAATGTTPVTDLILPNVASAAAFSLDQSKIFILTNVGTMYVYSTVDALAPVPIPASGTAAAFSADGSFAYVAGEVGGAGSVSAFSTCATPIPTPGVPSKDLGSATTSGAPLQIFPSPNVQTISQGGQDFLSQNILVLESPANTPPSVPPVVSSIQVLNAQFTQIPIATTEPLPAHSQLTCNPPDLNSLVASSTLYNLGAGDFTPVYARLVGNGSEMIIVARHIPAVLVFNVASGTTTAVHLVNNPNSPDPLSASASSDGSQVYVAACDQYPNNDSTQPCAAGSVHIVNTINLGDFQQVPYINNSTNNMCNNLGANAPLCIADLVAIKPE